jgi:hypothetical protein
MQNAIVQYIEEILLLLVSKQDELFSRVRDLYYTKPVPPAKEGMPQIFNL